jgi:hypothetical protein
MLDEYRLKFKKLLIIIIMHHILGTVALLTARTRETEVLVRNRISRMVVFCDQPTAESHREAREKRYFFVKSELDVEESPRASLVGRYKRDTGKHEVQLTW